MRLLIKQLLILLTPSGGGAESILRLLQGEGFSNPPSWMGLIDLSWEAELWLLELPGFVPVLSSKTSVFLTPKTFLYWAPPF